VPDVSFSERAVIVTGAASGIGLATARAFAAQGGSVLLVDINGDQLRAAQAGIAAAGGRCAIVEGDVGNESTAQAAVQRCIEAFDRLDVLVSAAGIARVGTVMDTSVEEFDDLFRTNVRSVFLFARAALPALRRAGAAAIVNVASEAGLVGFPTYAAYAASKAAVVNLTRSMALDHAPEGIRVNCVCPGSIETPLLQRFYDDQPDPAGAREEDERDHPLGIGSPETVAQSILFLAGPGSAYITGHALAVDGGYTAK
jgi:meso-butanediol dehydrogenase/(S,S)-butanediol dehydrogenase/diacetyl reductase